MAQLKPLHIGELTAQIPLIQGGMGVGISLSGLAGAVAAQGGIGVISAAQIGFRDAAFDEHPVETNLRVLKDEIRRAKEIARGGIIGVNIMVATRFYEQYVRAAVEAGADLIISGAGLPMKLPELVGSAQAGGGAGTKIAPIVSGVKSVEVIFKYWLKKYSRLPDMVVIEGPKAGGHLGFSMEKLESVTDAEYEEEIVQMIARVKEYAQLQEKKIPVVVAGGVYTREDAERCIGLGADGVQMATRFVTTYECDASDAYKQAYINAEKEDIVLVNSPVGMPGRAILNPFMERAKQGRIPHGKCHLCISTCKQEQTPYCITEALVNAANGNVDNALLFCGSNAYRAKELVHVKDIMDEFR